MTDTGVCDAEELGVKKDYNLIDGKYKFISLKKGASISKSFDAFNAPRESRMGITFAERFQVSECGDLEKLDEIY